MKKLTLLVYFLLQMGSLVAQIPHIRGSLADSMAFGHNISISGSLSYTEQPFNGYYIQKYRRETKTINEFTGASDYAYMYSILVDTLIDKSYCIALPREGNYTMGISNVKELQNAFADSLYSLPEIMTPMPDSLSGMNIHNGGDIYLEDSKNNLIIAFKLEGTILILDSSNPILLYSAYNEWADVGDFNPDLEAELEYMELPLVVINKINTVKHGVPAKYRHYKYMPKLMFIEY